MELSEKILIITDSSRNIEYNDFKPYYNFELVQESNLQNINIIDFELAIVDYLDFEKIKKICNKVRDDKKGISILILSDFKSKLNHKLLKISSGYGQIRVLNYRKEYMEEIIEVVNEMIHPEFPATTSNIAIILPVYNEESRFENVLNFFGHLEHLFNESFINSTVYFVDDGSDDETEGLVDKVIEKYRKNTNVISNISFANMQKLNINTRKAGTYIEGIQTIKADILVFVDADDSFQIADIAHMINIINEGYYDIVVGTKDLTAENRPLIRRILSFIKRFLTKPFLPKGIYDSQTGLKAMSGTAARYILPHLHIDAGLAIDLEILYSAKIMKFRVLQLPVKCIDREGSHINVIKDSIKFLKTLLMILKRRNELKEDELK